ncbi:hypothetical protein NL676_017379 [Syzygium grande]|nr:hypothetical protein NL676_017379 [Syzygium grande]
MEFSKSNNCDKRSNLIIIEAEVSNNCDKRSNPIIIEAANSIKHLLYEVYNPKNARQSKPAHFDQQDHPCDGVEKEVSNNCDKRSSPIIIEAANSIKHLLYEVYNPKNARQSKPAHFNQQDHPCDGVEKEVSNNCDKRSSPIIIEAANSIKHLLYEVYNPKNARQSKPAHFNRQDHPCDGVEKEASNNCHERSNPIIIEAANSIKHTKYITLIIAYHIGEKNSPKPPCSSDYWTSIESSEQVLSNDHPRDNEREEEEECISPWKSKNRRRSKTYALLCARRRENPELEVRCDGF